MNKILKRDEYINEVYTPMMEQKQYEELKMINEGLLKTLFGMAKNLFKKDWETIKGDSNIIAIYKELDDKLTGYSIMKLSKKDECNQIRQALVDMACDWYELKMNKAKESGEDPKPAKSMKFKNDNLRENLDLLQKKIKEIAGGDEQMLKWSQRLLDDMKIVINDAISPDIKDDDVKKELKKEKAEILKKSEEINKQMEKWQKDQLDAIQKEREALITNVNATPEKGDVTGDKEVAKLSALFKDHDKAKFIESAKNDALLGIKHIFKSTNGSNELKMSDRSFNILDSFYNKLNADSKLFKDTPAQSVQAMCISMNSFVRMCGSTTGKFDASQIELMARCAILSNGALSYNLPLNDKTGKDAGNYFTDRLGEIVSGKLKSVNNEDIKVPSNFIQNAKDVFKKVTDKANKLKEDSEKKREQDLKTLK